VVEFCWKALTPKATSLLPADFAVRGCGTAV
jgi:hypothetical protein